MIVPIAPAPGINVHTNATIPRTNDATPIFHTSFPYTTLIHTRCLFKEQPTCVNIPKWDIFIIPKRYNNVKVFL